MANLVGGLHDEIVRVTELRELYLTIPMGNISANGLMAPALRRAREALESGEVVEMMTALEDLRGFTE